jgi:hypothetical protein
MKATVTYYDIEEDKAVTKKCFEFSYNSNTNEFYFTPVDEPVKMYKQLIVDSPTIYMGYATYGLKITVKGWMSVKSGGYSKTTTEIRIENEE